MFLPHNVIWFTCIEAPVNRIPVIQRISPVVGPMAGGSLVVVAGVDLNVYPALGAHFVDDQLPPLYGYALNSR